MYVLAQGLAAEPDPPTAYDDDGAGVWRATASPWIGRRVARRATSAAPGGGDAGVVRVEAWVWRRVYHIRARRPSCY